jgi:hypothetical protein
MQPEELTFEQSIAAARTSGEVWAALRRLAADVAGHKLFTVMTVDLAAGLARRAYSDHPAEYPVSGSKPIHRDRWFDIVHGQQQCFVANTIEEIADVFPDYALIASLGCGSVINLPVAIDGELVATINLLHEAHHYTPARVAAAAARLTAPATLACTLARRFDLGSKKPE